MKEIATIYDLARMCKANVCESCPAGGPFGCDAGHATDKELVRLNGIILEWCKEHPVKTRQDKFLEMFPNAELMTEIINICPRNIGAGGYNERNCHLKHSCMECRRSYWLAEVEE